MTFLRGIVAGRRKRRIARPFSTAPLIASLLGGVMVALALPLIVGALGGTATPRANSAPATPPFTGTTNALEVHAVINLDDPELHPRQLAYDAKRNGLWFWTSTQQRGVTFTNILYFYAIASQHLQSWPLYDGDWSAQLLAGLAVAPDGDVWVGWNQILLDFHPASGSFARYMLPPRARFPLPAAVLGDRPDNLGIADLVIGRDGTVWIARYGALSVTSFVLASHSFVEYPLPENAGDPAKLALSPDGHLFFTVNLSADHPGYGAEKVGDFDTRAHQARIYEHAALTLAVAPNGDLYTAVSSPQFGVQRLTAAERANAAAQQRAPNFVRWMVPFEVDDSTLAIDGHGRVWMAVGGAPQLALLDPGTDAVRRFTYAAPSIAGHPLPHPPVGLPPTTPAPGAVWVAPIVAMATDRQGHLWYIRGGSDVIEEVAA